MSVSTICNISFNSLHQCVLDFKILSVEWKLCVAESILLVYLPSLVEDSSCPNGLPWSASELGTVLLSVFLHTRPSLIFTIFLFFVLFLKQFALQLDISKSD